MKEGGTMSSFYVDFKSRTPIYEQLIENISGLVLRGVLSPNEPIPSVRQLASELGINPNTIHKAYAELERRGIIYSTLGRGSFVSDDVDTVKEKKRAEILGELRRTITTAHEIGVKKDDIEAIINDILHD